jgi:hypothetical protein
MFGHPAGRLIGQSLAIASVPWSAGRSRGLSLVAVAARLLGQPVVPGW